MASAEGLTITQKKSITEGQAEISLTTDKVFYNPVQEFNRDLSIAVLSVFTDEYKAEKLALALKKTLKKEKVVEDVMGNGDCSQVCVNFILLGLVQDQCKIIKL